LVEDCIILKGLAVILQCTVINLRVILPNFARLSAVQMLLRADESMEHHLRKVVFLKLLITTLVDEIMEIEDKNSHFLVLQHIGLRITYLKYSEYSGLS
jgi:hypothetical protein